MKNALAIDEISDLLLQTGYRKPISSLTTTDKKEIISALLDYHVMLKVKGAMDQYMDGLEALGQGFSKTLLFGKFSSLSPHKG